MNLDDIATVMIVCTMAQMFGLGYISALWSF